MGIVNRNGNTYYYRSIRRGGRVTSEYVAGGELARPSASIAATSRALRAEERAARREWRAGRDAEERRLVGALDDLAAAARLALALAGYHRHDRGRWRRRRMNDAVLTAPAPASAGPKAEAPTDPAAVEALLARAGSGDRSCLPQLRALYDRDPWRWRRRADLANGIESVIAENMYGEKLDAIRGLKLKLAEIRAELAGADPSPAEALLAERAALAWLEACNCQLLAVSPLRDARKQAYWDRRHDRAHGRFLSALKALAQVRRLRVPTVQVNIAGQQINQVVGG